MMKGNATFNTLQILRLLFGLTLLAFLARTIDLGTSLLWLGSAIFVGTAAAGFLLKRKVTFLKSAFWHFAIFLVFYLTSYLANFFVTGDVNSPVSDFVIYQYWDRISIWFLFYILSFLSTWFFWTIESALTLEAVIVSVGVTYLLGSHRNYHLDAPKKISELAWEFGVAPQHTLIALGAVFIVLLLFYLYLGSNRPLFSALKQRTNQGRGRLIGTIATSLVALAMLLGFGAYINKMYSADLSRATNGVGQQTSEGSSPLGFHSAIGDTKQPAALVRLEGNYEENPWQPMLYLREGALSSFNGHEIVVAPSNFDTDVPRIKPGQPFVAKDTPNSAQRKKLVHSVYLLTKHEAPFAIDYPQSFRVIKNPDPDRFALSYQALSLTPTVSQQDLVAYNVGDPSWSDDTWKHYLRAPGSKSALNPLINTLDSTSAVPDSNGEDLRYRALAEQLTKDFNTSVLKAAAISQYLSQVSIYTRKPGHKATTTDDPVAPYLFSKDKRGYCVHFAHAAVYMMRLVGIPARIGTGYLTDLSYAKDGHILLHLGDRHAWPEVYIEGIGWSVFDVTPQQAENEQAIVPDEKLLEDLMSKIDPAEEFIPPDVAESTEESLDEKIFATVVDKKLLLFLLLTLLFLLLSFKIWCRLGYKLPVPPKRKAKLAYLSFASLMADLGHYRSHGETRLEFKDRIIKDLGVNASRLNHLLEHNLYSVSNEAAIESTLPTAISEWRNSFKHRRKWWQPILAFFSPLSFTRMGRW